MEALASVRAFFTPFRLVVAAICIVLVATGFVALRARQLELARKTFRSELAAGQRALAAADLVDAREHFAVAAEAVETLGSDDAQARMVRQLYRETRAMTALAPGSLFDMLTEAEKSLDRIGSLTWDDIFRARYQDTWLVFFSPVRRDEAGFILDLPLSVGSDSRRVVVRADLPDFRRLAQDRQVFDVAFAAPLAGCLLDERSDQWIVTLDSRAGFLWSDLENLRRLGFLDSDWSDEELMSSVLAAQADLGELSQ